MINPSIVPGTIIHNQAAIADSQGNAARASDLIRTLSPHPAGPPVTLTISGQSPASAFTQRSFKVSFSYKGLAAAVLLKLGLTTSNVAIFERTHVGNRGSAGHVSWDPSQDSGTSQAPAGRHQCF